MGTTKEVDLVFLIADLAGYTALTEAHGARGAAQVVTRYVEIAHQTLQPGARVVEQVGDELLIAAEDMASAIRTAVRLREAVEGEPLFPAVRAGLHAGNVLEQDGRYFGTALNLTARVAGYARAGQILCTEPPAAVARSLPGIECCSAGVVRFKNIADPVPIFEILAGSRRGTTDPVCRMQVSQETAPARLPFGERTYYFCSFQCAHTFAQRPDDYAST